MQEHFTALSESIRINHSISALPDELGMTVRAGDVDLAPPTRHAQPLPALGALEIPMGLAVRKAHAGVSQTVLYRSPPAQELLIFRIARLDIAREHAEIAQDEQRQNEHAHPAQQGHCGA